MHFMHRLIVVVLICMGLNDHLWGQTSALPNLMSPMAASPNAASLGKFGELPVGYYTGIPSINVPLYEINTGGIKVPITLDYHAGGVKVEDIASWVGIGWALNAGGVITRQVRGVPDDSGPNGYLVSHDSITKYINGTLHDYLKFVEDVADQGEMDSEQDLFFYNFCGGSGKFVFDTTGACIAMPTSKYKIEFGSFLGKDQVFKITDLSGNQYFFTDKETTTYGFNVNGGFSKSAYDAISSWYLTQINNVLNTDSITFSYGSIIDNIETLGTQTKYVGDGCRPRPDFITTGSNLVHGLFLSSINFRNGTITFNRNSQNRCDITSERALNSVTIQSIEGGYYKKYDFYQSYSSHVVQAPNTCDPDPKNSRLFLDSLSFSDQSKVIGKYKFNYISRGILPSRFSFSQDLWGYYNGRANNSLIPTARLPNATYVVGANRDVDFTYAAAGTLNSIVYPTGGRTEFQYELNAVNNLSINQSTVVSNHLFLFNIPNDTQRLIDTTFQLTDDDGSGGVLMSWTFSPINGCSGPPHVGCPVTTITDGAGLLLGISATSGNHFINKGTIHVKLDLRNLDDNISASDLQSYFLSLTWKTISASVDSLRYNAPVGGLRIKKMTNYTTGNSIASVRRYTYNMPDLADYSSGTILSYPVFIGSIAILNEFDECNATTINSTSKATLATDQSSYTTYKYVQELLGDNGEFGKNQYQFTSADLDQDIIVTTNPFPPGISRDWKRGKLVHERNFRYNGLSGQHELIKETMHTYMPIVTNTYDNLKIIAGVVSSIPYTHGFGQYGRARYTTEVGWCPVMSDTIRIYDQTDLTKYQQTTTSYTYSDTHYQPVSVTTINSKGEITITQNKYPLDFPGLTANDNFTSGIRNLQNKNVITPVIENYLQLKNSDGSNTRTLRGQITSYRPDRVLPDTIWTTEFAAPSTSFTSTSVSGGRILRNVAYLPQIEMLRYDPTGNIIEQRKKVDARHTYLWNYQSSYPVAEVVNADSASIAYTSFEADGSGNWSIGSTTRDTTQGITGKRSYNLSSNISKSGLNSATTYIISYWTKNNSPFSISGTMTGYPTKGKNINGWTLYVHKVTGQTTISLNGSGLIDELRLYPADAQMTTYTYTPLVGMSSQCDIGNRITYYEYDGLQRLIRIRDQDYNIIKSIDYQYQAAGGCGSNCYSIGMQTFAGTGTLSYPVGVFSVQGKLLGNASNAAQYVTLWNNNTEDASIGVLSTGSDSMHFNMVLNAGKVLPAAVTGCRYYQMDMDYTQLDGVRNINGAYVDFGDGTGMRLGNSYNDIPSLIAPNTTSIIIQDGTSPINSSAYFIHNYPDGSLKTLTFYHNDAGEHAHLDNVHGNALGLTKLKNLRGYLPQHTDRLGGSCYQDATVNSLSNILNWNAINSVLIFNMNKGDGAHAATNMNYAQDFMQNNKGLQVIYTSRGYRFSGYLDPSFKISRLKSDWNTYFTNLQQLLISDDHWNREDLSALKHLTQFSIDAATIDHTDNAASPLNPIPQNVIDNILKQIAAGAGPTASNGINRWIVINSGGPVRSAASDAAVNILKANGWSIAVNGIIQ